PRLIAARALASVSSLDLSAGNLDDDALEMLLSSPHLGRLRRLDLSNNQLTDRAVRLLAGSGLMNHLRALSLRNNQITGEGLTALAATMQLPNLTELELHDNPLDRISVQSLSEWQRTRSTRRTRAGHPLYFFGPLGMEFRLIPAGSFPMGSPSQ